MQPRSKAVFISFLCSVNAVFGAELLYQEGFNTDGEPAGRYTLQGKDVYEVPRIQAEIGNFDQKGPIYWAHNFDVSYAGIPTIPGRRMIFTWKSDPNGGAATEDLLKLFESSIAWLTTNKANMTIVVNPTAASIGELADRLIAAGHNVIDDDTGAFPDEQDVVADLFIHGPGANNASRFAMVPKPVIVMNEPDYDDMLVGSIGSAVTFDPGQVTISNPAHPAAGGKTGSFAGFNNPAQPFGIIGSFLPPGATTLATVTRIIPPAINNLTDLDDALAGKKQHEESTGTVSDLDFSDGSPGSWGIENTIPGDYTGNWGLRATGKVNVSIAGTYRFALGSDDGARLSIDLDRNGLTAADLLVEDPGPHGHQIVYTNVTFSAAGDYDYEVRSYNSGGGGSLEVSVSLVEAPVPDDALESGYWEVLSENGTGAVKLKAAANITAIRASGPDVEKQEPLIVLLNGPTDNPPGSFYDGGPFTGFEGTGFLGAAGLNKWTAGYENGYRSVILKPVNVAGKPDVKLTVALAGTTVDFETSDRIKILVHPNGLASAPVTLANFHGVRDAIQPWLADEMDNYVRRLTKQFADFTYNVPAGATDLVVEIQVSTTWWTEIAAIDNIRITSGPLALDRPAISVSRSGTDIVLTLDAGASLQRTTNLGATPIQWQDVVTTGGTYTVPSGQQGGYAFFRAKR
jgi:hypothetical protein